MELKRRRVEGSVRGEHGQQQAVLKGRWVEPRAAPGSWSWSRDGDKGTHCWAMHTFPCTLPFPCMYLLSKLTYMHAYAHACLHACLLARIPTHAYAHACLRAYMLTCMLTGTHLNLHACMLTCVCMLTCMLTCMCMPVSLLTAAAQTPRLVAAGNLAAECQAGRCVPRPTT